jgi:hypothetical protein
VCAYAVRRGEDRDLRGLRSIFHVPTLHRFGGGELAHLSQDVKRGIEMDGVSLHLEQEL